MGGFCLLRFGAKLKSVPSPKMEVRTLDKDDGGLVFSVTVTFDGGGG